MRNRLLGDVEAMAKLVHGCHERILYFHQYWLQILLQSVNLMAYYVNRKSANCCSNQQPLSSLTALRHRTSYAGPSRHCDVVLAKKFPLACYMNVLSLQFGQLQLVKPMNGAKQAGSGKQSPTLCSRRLRRRQQSHRTKTTYGGSIHF